MDLCRTCKKLLYRADACKGIGGVTECGRTDGGPKKLSGGSSVVELSTTQKGDITVAMVTAKCLEMGVAVHTPTSEHSRYDLVIDRGHGFERVQCKTGRLRSGAVEFNTVSIAAPHRGGKKQGYHGEADLFGVYCAATGGVYLMAVAEAANSSARLRVEPTKNGQSAGVLWAKDYALVEGSTPSPRSKQKQRSGARRVQRGSEKSLDSRFESGPAVASAPPVESPEGLLKTAEASAAHLAPKRRGRPPGPVQFDKKAHDRIKAAERRARERAER